jgi:hypothetical protein
MLFVMSCVKVMTNEGGIPADRCFYNFRDVGAESFGKNDQTIAALRAAAAAATEPK